MLTGAGATNAAPSAGELMAISTGGNASRTVTLSNTLVCTNASLRAVTASPTQTVLAISMVVKPTDVHVTPSDETNPWKALPVRRTRSHWAGRGPARVVS